MVRDPSIVSPSLTGVFIGGGHNKHGTGSRCTLPKQCRPPSPRRRWRCDRSSYKRSLFSRIRDSQMHYLTGPETIVRQHPVTVSDLCGVEPISLTWPLEWPGGERGGVGSEARLQPRGLPAHSRRVEGRTTVSAGGPQLRAALPSRREASALGAEPQRAPPHTPHAASGWSGIASEAPRPAHVFRERSRSEGHS